MADDRLKSNHSWFCLVLLAEFEKSNAPPLTAVFLLVLPSVTHAGWWSGGKRLCTLNPPVQSNHWYGNAGHVQGHRGGGSHYKGAGSGDLSMVVVGSPPFWQSRCKSRQRRSSASSVLQHPRVPERSHNNTTKETRVGSQHLRRCNQSTIIYLK